ncbi:MAG TPA: hypothetical protein VLM38_16495 [Blastocatellia bacterium]|nr:hypothetical protein [Blastocatellia bacterium]
MREVVDDFAVERFNHSLASAKAEVIKFTAPQLDEKTAPRESRIAAGQTLSRRFLLVK